MSLRIRRGTSTELGLITPEEGELIYTTDTKRLYLGDGTTVGGISASGISVNLGAVTQHIIPSANITYDLGSATNRFRDIYLSSSTINLGGAAISVNSSGQLTSTETVGGEGVGGISSVQWVTGNQLRSRTSSTSEFITKYESLKVGDQITLLTGQSGAFTNTVLTVSGQVTKTSSISGNFYDFVIPVDISPPANIFVYRFTLTRVPASGSSTFLANGTKTASLASTGVLTVPGSIIPDTNITYDLGSATNRFRDIYLSTNTINLGTNSVSVGSSGQLLINGNNAATELVLFGGEGFGPNNAAALAWGTQDQVTWGQPYILVYGPGSALKQALFELKIGDKIKMGQGPDNGRPSLGEITVTVVSLPTTTYASNGYPQIVIQVDSAPVATTANFVYVLYLPVRDTPATIANGTKSLMVLPSGYVVFPTVTVPAHSYGVAGDVAGMLAFDSTYIYYCTANYVNNSTNIWKRTAHGTGTW